MEYLRPKSLKEVLQTLKSARGKAKLIAGGTNVIPDMRAKASLSAVLVDIGHLRALSYIKVGKERVRIGGLTLISDLATSKAIQKVAPVLAEAAQRLGNPLVRNRATLAGNLADASPAADTAVPLLVLGASVIAERKGVKPRQIPMERFFLGPNRTVLRRDEVILEIVFPKPGQAARMAYTKLGLRNSMAISVVSLAVLIKMEKKICKEARIGLGAVAPRPMRSLSAERFLIGQSITEETIKACCNKVCEEISPITDIRASAEYRKSMASVLLKRLLKRIV